MQGGRGFQEKKKERKKERNGTDRLLLVYLTQWEIESRRVLASLEIERLSEINMNRYGSFIPYDINWISH